MFIKINQLNIHYKVVGQGDPILLLHGWGCNLNYFKSLQYLLANYFTVYSLDLPGFGWSTQPATVWGSFEYAQLVQQFTQALTIEQPIILGHSMGGKIAIQLVAQALVPASKLILLSSAGIRLPLTRWQVYRSYCLKILKFLTQLPLLKRILAASYLHYREQLGSQDYRNAQGRMRSILVRLVHEDLRQLLPRITIPSLLLWGDNDRAATLVAGKLMAELMPKAELIIFRSNGHHLLFEDYQQVVTALAEFLGLS